MFGVFFWMVVPAALGLLVASAPGMVRRWPLVTGGLLSGVYLLGGIALLPIVVAGESMSFSRAWVPELGVDLGLRITSFSAWFAILILALGASVLLYASSYFKANRSLPFLLACLLLFTSSMLGVVWSDNFFLLFFFWEATSLLSFLLVGFHHEKESTRDKASQALLVTLLGGAAMLAGFVMIHLQTGMTTLSGLFAYNQVHGFSNSTAMVCIVLGALTKSAQFPFHFWLPNAMAGPTPVSAYLHSATMVKAGVFLLAVMAPVFAADPLWTPLLVASGLLTVMAAVARAWNDDDMKSILASTTLCALGLLTVLAGVGGESALKAFVIVLTAHALYKAPLFLSAGNLEKQFGSRRLSELHGAARRAPLTGVGVVLALLSLLGLPPLGGFLAKEYFLKALWEHTPWLALLSCLALAGSVFLGLRIIVCLMARDHVVTRKKPLPTAMAVACLWPVLVMLLLAVFHQSINQWVYSPVVHALSGGEAKGYSYWHGWTAPLVLGLGAVCLAIFVMGLVQGAKPSRAGRSSMEGLYDLAVKVLGICGKSCGRWLEKGPLSVHLTLILCAVGVLSLFSIRMGEWPSFESLDLDHSVFVVLVAPALAIATVIAARSHRPMAILVSLGFVGLLVAFLFLWMSAPDLALTQLLAETLILFLISGVLLKSRASGSSGKIAMATFPRLLIAGASTLLVSVLILKSIAVEWDRPVSDYYLANSMQAAYGANVVNVILVDFRALDTLGEIVVLAIAALGASAALGAARSRVPLPASKPSPWLAAAFPFIAWFLVLAALWIFWRGHNAPGGGFIAALILASVAGLGYLTHSPAITPVRMRRLSSRLLVVGLSLALFSAILPMFSGLPFFTGLWLHFDSIHLGTPLLFDLGVMLTVSGFTLSYLRHFHHNQALPCK